MEFYFFTIQHPEKISERFRDETVKPSRASFGFTPGDPSPSAFEVDAMVMSYQDE